MVLSPFGFCGSRRQWVVNPRTRVSRARDYSRATSPRVYKSPWSPRPLQGNQPPCVYKSSWNPRPLQSNQPPVSAKAPGTRDHCRATSPPRLQKFLDLNPSEGNRPRVWNRSLCPRLLKATSLRNYKSSSKAEAPGDNQSHSNPDLPV